MLTDSRQVRAGARSSLFFQHLPALIGVGQLRFQLFQPRLLTGNPLPRLPVEVTLSHPLVKLTNFRLKLLDSFGKLSQFLLLLVGQPSLAVMRSVGR